MRYLDNSIHVLRVWWSSLRISLVRELEFRLNFFLGIIRQALWLCLFVFMIQTIFHNTDSLAGWSKEEVFIVLALSRLIEGLINFLFTSNIMELPGLVQKGAFDYYLLRPIPAQFGVAFRRIFIHQIGNIIAGVVLLIYALSLQGWPSVGSWLSFVFLAALGITVYYSLSILVATLVFYLDRLEALWSFMTLFSEPLTVPFDIFPRPARVTLTYLLPLAFVVFIPAKALTHRLSLAELGISLLLVVIFLTLANLAWRSGLRRYSSASS